MSATAAKGRTIKVDVLARVEGEGAFTVKVQNGTVRDAVLRIYEPPRFFEAFMRGRRYGEAPDITARICGICPVAYQMSAVQAMEEAFGAPVDGPLRSLRRLLYCGEWIESHALHVYMLHAPDFLGYESGVHMAKDYAAVVTRGLQLKKLGNQIVTIVGGREIHPVNVRVGGFYRAPTVSDLAPVAEKLSWALDAALETVRWVSRFRFPDFECEHDYVALRHDKEYAVLSGRVVSSRGLDIPSAEYEKHFTEEHEERSNALHSVLAGHGPYLAGPLARYNLNYDQLTPVAQQAARDAGLGRTCHNPFKSIVVRAVELVEAVEVARQLVTDYERPAVSSVPVTVREGRGTGVSEAPRGLLYHRYTVTAAGLIADAKIVPPTAQNQRAIEVDLSRFVERHLDLDDQALTWSCEQAIRNYDPCISCATHFLKLDVSRG
jgi:coenzyme F420-reducing hydrogenase alpha subunit